MVRTALPYEDPPANVLVHLHVHLHDGERPGQHGRPQMTLDIVIIAVGILVFVVPAAWSRIRGPVAEERRRLDGERQRLAHERRRLAAAAQPAGGRRSGCPWCGFPISPG
jgi:hypothetical protein